MDKEQFLKDLTFIRHVINELGNLTLREESYTHNPNARIEIKGLKTGFLKTQKLEIIIEKSKDNNPESLNVIAISNNNVIEVDLYFPILIDMLRKSNQYDAKLQQKLNWLNGTEIFPF